MSVNRYREKEVVFWDVDTQYDFLMPDGKLYVPGAVDMIDSISRTRRFAIENGFSIIASMDHHTMRDPEISLTPDLITTFPPHCMAGQPGAQRVGFLGNLPIEYIDTQTMPPEHLHAVIAPEQFHIVIRTSTVNVFDNPNTLELLELIRPETVIVFGVATDVCVRHAINGLLSLKETKVILLKDIVRGLEILDEEGLISQFQSKRVAICQLAQLIEILDQLIF